MPTADAFTTLASKTTSEAKVLGLNSNAFCMNSKTARIFKKTHNIGLSPMLQC